MLSQKIREHSALHRILSCLTEIWNLEPMRMTILHCAGPLSGECKSSGSEVAQFGRLLRRRNYRGSQPVVATPLIKAGLLKFS